MLSIRIRLTGSGTSPGLSSRAVLYESTLSVQTNVVNLSHLLEKPVPDPHLFWKPDPDLHQSKKLNLHLDMFKIEKPDLDLLKVKSQIRKRSGSA
jgi:hypothetical protein